MDHGILDEQEIWFAIVNSNENPGHRISNRRLLIIKSQGPKASSLREKGSAENGRGLLLIRGLSERGVWLKKTLWAIFSSRGFWS